MNKLDDKVIVDRKSLQWMYERLEAIDGMYSSPLEIEQALAADLTGWAAVPVNFNLKMYYAGAEEKTVRETYRAMLSASQPLPGGGE